MQGDWAILKVDLLLSRSCLKVETISSKAIRVQADWAILKEDSLLPRSFLKVETISSKAIRVQEVGLS